MRGNMRNAVAGGSVLLDRGVIDRMRLTWRLLRDERVSALKFALPVLLALYVGSPVDVVPDLFLGIGQMDDVGVVVAVVLLMTRIVPSIAPQSIVEEHLRAMNARSPAPEPGPAAENPVIEARYSVRP
ncbi:MAG: YkvA family protein [Thermomicrobiales bacterium]